MEMCQRPTVAYNFQSLHILARQQLIISIQATTDRFDSRFKQVTLAQILNLKNSSEASASAKDDHYQMY